MIIMNRYGVVLRVNAANVIFNKALLLELGCKIWSDENSYNRTAKRKGFPVYKSSDYDSLYVDFNEQNQLMLRKFSHISGEKIETYSIEVYIANLSM